jgi:hypothetical protein
MLAEKIATTVIQPSTSVRGLFTRYPISARLFVISRISSISGGGARQRAWRLCRQAAT